MAWFSSALGGSGGAPLAQGGFSAGAGQSALGGSSAFGGGLGQAASSYLSAPQPGFLSGVSSAISDFARGAWNPSAGSAGQNIALANKVGATPALGDLVQYFLQNQVHQQFAPMQRLAGMQPRPLPSLQPRQTSGGIMSAIGSI